IYSTYLGGALDDYGNGIKVDNFGAAYVTGRTFSSDFPTYSQYQTDQGGCDVYITKISALGDSIVYSTYLGGSDIDMGWDISIDNAGSAYITGQTYSSDFPTTASPFQSDQAGVDVFVTKLSHTGNTLVYSTYLGGDDYELGHGIEVDAYGSAFVAGYTESSDFPTVNAYQLNQADLDAFVTKFSNTGNSVVYSTYLGGNGFDNAYGITIDKFGAAYITGQTGSSDFPMRYEYDS
ncbi:MAG: hypothetical protein GWN00_31030, partial [Aliifodinibius sp.]|nr:hypothetical protein [Fodinibius sp.]NIW48163.1 hypothetical protein [Gammaproteobacteria bacterium]NIX58679.1 hypothetical protein [candidate division Zixibacteria bacterium]NIY29060.1 hypothetical protein [Fodinibius sp.]